jgi:hypothetical protein
MSLSFIVEASFRKLTVRGSKTGFGSAKSVLFVRGVESRQTLTRLDRIADVDQTLKNAAAQTESEINLDLAFNRAGELNGPTSPIFINGYDANRPDLLYGFFSLRCAR